MIFFFGGSRSWAAREARRKARQMAQKKRRAIIKTTISMFSLIVLSISLWSLIKMRQVGITKPTLETNSLKEDHGNISNAVVKTLDSANEPEHEVPHAPMEPPPTGFVRKADNASTVGDGSKDSIQGHGSEEIVRNAENHSSGRTMEMGDETHHQSSQGENHPSGATVEIRDDVHHQSSGHVESVYRASRDGESNERSLYRSNESGYRFPQDREGNERNLYHSSESRYRSPRDGENSERSSYHSNESGYRSPRVGESSERSYYHSNFHDRESNPGAGARGMTHEEIGGFGSSHSEGMMQSGQRAINEPLHDSNGGVQKQEAVDVLDTEEGGEGPAIMLPERKSSSGYKYGELSTTAGQSIMEGLGTATGRSGEVKEGTRQNFDDGLMQRRDETSGKAYSTDSRIRSARDTTAGEGISSRLNEHSIEEPRNAERVGGYALREVPSLNRMASESHHYGDGPTGNGNMVGGSSTWEATNRDHVVSRNGYMGGGLRRQGGTFERGVVGGSAANGNRIDSGSRYHDNEIRKVMEAGTGAAGNIMEKRVAVGSSGTQDLSSFVTNADVKSRSTSSIDTKHDGSFVRSADAARPIAAGSGVTGYDLAVRNGVRL